MQRFSQITVQRRRDLKGDEGVVGCCCMPIDAVLSASPILAVSVAAKKSPELLFAMQKNPKADIHIQRIATPVPRSVYVTRSTVKVYKKRN